MEKEEDESSRVWRSNSLNDPNFNQVKGGGLKRRHPYKTQCHPIISSSSPNNVFVSDRCSSISSTCATSDPLLNSMHMLLSLPFQLHTEVEKIKQLAKDICSLRDDSNVGDTPFHGWASELNRLYSNKNVGILETQIGEAEGRLKEREKETIKNMIPRQRKTCQHTEAEVDRILEEKIQVEIQHILIRSCTKDWSVLVEDQIKLLRKQKGVAMKDTFTSIQNNDVMLIQGTEGGGNIINMRRKAVTSAKCFGIQLSLLVLVAALFMSRLTPKSAVVVPT